MDFVWSWVVKVLAFIGMDPGTFGAALAFGYILRFARAGIEKFRTGSTLLCAAGAGVAVIVSAVWEAGWKFVPGAGQAGIAVTGLVLASTIAMKALSNNQEKIAEKMPEKFRVVVWAFSILVPVDDQYVKKESPPPPPQGG